MPDFGVILHGGDAQQVVHAVDDRLQVGLLAELARGRRAEFVVRKGRVQSRDEMKQSFAGNDVTQNSAILRGRGAT